MAQSTSDIQKRSDDKRGVKVKGIKLHVDTIALLERLAEETGESQAAVVTKALNMLAESIKK
ncbi:hypothetical protein MT962_000638 [Franconibacter sp. IITDAS19]|uniref:hypothetical protein n=1 Tax=Franconibacter sp. IITDAS19 TaxID=2930569 RepID=UPI001FFA4DDF|nr:hypothetical protein [Franconibacter sp. IITDAS19]MCK1966852.1 hypothetical protein [Franconibacter sp. IITDAS19]